MSNEAKRDAPPARWSLFSEAEPLINSNLRNMRRLNWKAELETLKVEG
jgi:hypothetical protein